MQILGLSIGDRVVYRITHDFSRFSQKSIQVSEGYSGPYQLDTRFGDQSSFETTEFQIPEIKAYFFSPATLFPINRFSSVFHKFRCFIPERTETGPFEFIGEFETRANLVVRHSAQSIVTKRPKRNQSLARGLYLGSRAPYNYYHWIVNGLPSLFIANRKLVVPVDYPAIIPRAVTQSPTLIEATDVLLGQRGVFVWDSDVELSVRELVTISPPPVYDTPLAMNQVNRKPISIHIPVMKAMREEILNRVLIDQKFENFPERVFLARPSGDLRAKNQPKLIEVAEEFGFSVVYPEANSFSKQVKIFSAARYVIGPGGAGFTNIIFCPRDSSVLIWRPGQIRSDNVFANLAAISESRCFVIPADYEAENSTTNTRGWILNPNLLRGVLSDWLSL